LTSQFFYENTSFHETVSRMNIFKKEYVKCANIDADIESCINSFSNYSPYDFSRLNTFKREYVPWTNIDADIESCINSFANDSLHDSDRFFIIQFTENETRYVIFVPTIHLMRLQEYVTDAARYSFRTASSMLKNKSLFDERLFTESGRIKNMAATDFVALFDLDPICTIFTDEGRVTPYSFDEWDEIWKRESMKPSTVNITRKYVESDWYGALSESTALTFGIRDGFQLIRPFSGLISDTGMQIVKWHYLAVERHGAEGGMDQRKCFVSLGHEKADVRHLIECIDSGATKIWYTLSNTTYPGTVVKEHGTPKIVTINRCFAGETLSVAESKAVDPDNASSFEKVVNVLTYGNFTFGCRFD
jgi:hypothetical protein